ncbi:retbindin [Denticeps clupeoides]|uniref:Folate receptor-like domain-containing protein n=1 Tax=Denticeps clupeoides TaxID=299321 RepID=A0AAY4C1H2_9TELE|nr:riboflavin-binding protein-like [Denticeps clupeoides]XP_028843510.1 riboflavin-binding protein-like [Denticeps clupeoides]XP_028843511.1 riboflavin-binding protein-like [Denticeps clupeoides]
MGVSANMLILAWLSASLLSWAWSEGGACLQDGRHKATPGPEPALRECSLYTDNACCSEDHIQDLVDPPASSENVPWDKCGSLTPGCKSFLKRVICFYRCSPDAARWPHPQHGSSLKAVPICHSFCRDWFEACRSELTCAREWAVDPRGHNCTGSCVPYQQMYQHGQDLCESLWGDAFVTVEDEEDDGGHACGCLNLGPTDRDVIAALRAREEDPEELDTTKSGLPQYRAPCHGLPRTATAPPRAGRRGGNAALRKRSVPLADVEAEGSGSGAETKV